MTTSTGQELKRFREDALYVQQNRPRLVQQYPDRWIGVFNREVIVVARTPKELVAELRRKGVAPGEAYRAFLATAEDLLIVPAS